MVIKNTESQNTVNTTLIVKEKEKERAEKLDHVVIKWQWRQITEIRDSLCGGRLWSYTVVGFVCVKPRQHFSFGFRE